MPPSPPQLTKNWTRLGLQLNTSQTALTTGIYRSISCGTTLETRGKFQGAYALLVEHSTVVWLVRNEKGGCLEAENTCRDVSALTEQETSRRQSRNLGLKSRLGHDTNKSHLLVLQVILSCTSIQVFQLQQSFSTGDSRSQAKVCVCQVCLSFLCCCGWCGSVVSASTCVWCYVYQCVWSCLRGTDYRKALGFARGSFWFL